MRKWLCVIAMVAAPIGMGACTATGASPTTTGPPVCSTYTAFAVSLVSNRGGMATPEKAAEWFAVHGGVSSIPKGGWLEMSREKQAATVYSGKTILHVAQGPAGTWQVDSGKHCS